MTNQKVLNFDGYIDGGKSIRLEHGDKTTLCSVFNTSYNTVRMALLGVTHTELALKIREYAVLNLGGLAV